MLTHIFQSEIKITMKTVMHMNNKYMYILNRKNQLVKIKSYKRKSYIFVDKFCALAC